jgi:hypothetical protein
MTVRLSPCLACARHVKVGACSCPFCGAKVACVAPPSVAGGERMSRAALFAAGALGTVLGATDCSSSSTPFHGASPPPAEAGSDAAESDAPSTPPDASGPPSDAAAPSDAREESPGVVALYGGFIPIDASKDSG